MIDYNAPPNTWTFGKAQQEFELSSGLSNLESVIERGTLTRSVEAPAGTARRQATETVIVPTRKMKEEDHRVATEVNKSLP